MKFCRSIIFLKRSSSTQAITYLAIMVSSLVGGCGFGLSVGKVWKYVLADMKLSDLGLVAALCPLRIS